MINFIIYENKKTWQEYYKKAILKVMENKKEKYQIIIIANYNLEIRKNITSLTGKNIFLLNMDVPKKSGLDLAKEIRKLGDWHSQIILITTYENFKEECFSNRFLLLEYIFKSKNMENRICESILVALKIHSHYKSFNFIYNNELYQIPYDDILYFEKNLNNNYTSIITKNHHYKVKC